MSKNEINAAPPHDLEIERVVLGSVIIDTRAIYQVLEFIKTPDVFYTDDHKKIFGAVLEMHDQGAAIDMLTIIKRLTGKYQISENPALYISQLAGKVSSTAHIEAHCNLLVADWIRRRVIVEGQKLVGNAYRENGDPVELISGITRDLETLVSETIKSGTRTLREIVQATLTEVEGLNQKTAGQVTGTRTGFKQIDEITNGWQKGWLAIVAGRPGMGKTAFAVKQIIEAAADNKPTVVLELEMRDEDITKRLICQMEPYFHANQLFVHGIKKDSEWDRLTEVAGALSEYPIVLECQPGLNVFDAMVKVRAAKIKYGDLGLVVVDYLQLMSGLPGKRYNNREQEISDISRYLKRMALELDTPVLALSQLSRATETRGSTKRPQLSDLRESGSLEQDADAVVLLYRPEYYDIDELEDGTPSRGVCELIVAKLRNGKVGTYLAGFNDNRIRFDELVTVQQQQSRAGDGSDPF
jgi:replicative DNA helicase